jgi:hypothetical protein
MNNKNSSNNTGVEDDPYKMDSQEHHFSSFREPQQEGDNLPSPHV